MKHSFLAVLCSLLSLLSGCAFPGTRLVLPVSLQVTLPTSSGRAQSATVVQLRHHASRAERAAFAAGQPIAAPDARTITAAVSAGRFSAEFPDYSESVVTWFVPPVPTWPASDILFRTGDPLTSPFILRGRSPYKVRLFQLAPSGATYLAPSATVSQTLVAPPPRAHHTTNKIDVRITE